MRRLNLPSRNEYMDQRRAAKVRGIPWELSYQEWLSVWQKSGHFHERGHRSGQYCMARHGDQGAYAVDNVKIITANANHSEGKGNRLPRTTEQKAKISAGLKAYFAKQPKKCAKPKEGWTTEKRAAASARKRAWWAALSTEERTARFAKHAKHARSFYRG